jgi:hypothetical protein
VRASALDFTRSGLESAGFVGWLPFANLRDASPSSPGVYVVIYTAKKPNAFLVKSGAGWFKGKDPTVPNEQLVANWVNGAEVVYIGKGDQLRRRLNQLTDFGNGKHIGHSGGRLIWQLPKLANLIVAWKETPGQIPIQVEKELIRKFRDVYGKAPFANDPLLMGR